MGKRERNKRRQERRARRERSARKVVREMVADYFADNPDATIEDAEPVLKDRIRAQFGSAPFLELLLKFLVEYLPIILELFSSDDDEED